MKASRPLVAVHVAASVAALACLITFWISTGVSEVFMGPREILFVKTGILIGLLVFIPLLVVAGASGRALSPKKQGRGRKARRLEWAALTGVTVLIPCAVAGYVLAARGEVSTPAFIVVQIIELVAGASNIRLLTLNVVTGVRVVRARAARYDEVAAGRRAGAWPGGRL